MLDNCDQDVAAHELGHNLELLHIYESNSTGNPLILNQIKRVLPEPNSTRNIMDYRSEELPNTHRYFFYKFQIDHLKNYNN
ncbi:hypothetical protein AGMMS49574_06920 [Bacteroidia bacterium]|nr:hypothetical protein AGMMS49574_06920 [Bacteroidia bacterium]